LRRQRQTIFWGLAVLLSAIALLAGVGAHSAKTAVTPDEAAASGAAAAKASSLTPSTVPARVNALPFTRLDFVLLLTGGGMLLVVGSSVRRFRGEGAGRR
jgi:hypothetical protein